MGRSYGQPENIMSPSTVADISNKKVEYHQTTPLLYMDKSCVLMFFYITAMSSSFLTL